MDMLSWTLPAVAAGAAVGLVNGSRRDAINVTGGLWGDLATLLSGIDLRVEGEENLWAQRPAVFIFNHQSGLDAPLMLKLVRRDVTGNAAASSSAETRRPVSSMPMAFLRPI